MPLPSWEANKLAGLKKGHLIKLALRPEIDWVIEDRIEHPELKVVELRISIHGGFCAGVSSIFTGLNVPHHAPNVVIQLDDIINLNNPSIGEMAFIMESQPL